MNVKYPIFFPDATRAVLRSVDSDDIKNAGIEGVLVNTYHLWDLMGDRISDFGGVGGFMNFDGPIISDSGGFQIMSMIKKYGGKVTDDGVIFKNDGRRVLFTPEDSISYQFKLETELLVVLDDFTSPGASKTEALETVERTRLWAERCKREYEKQCSLRKIDPGSRPGMTDGGRPYLIGVVQGGEYLDLRRESAEGLASIGFDGFGYGGWPLRQAQGKPGWEFNYEVAELIADCAPDNYLLYGLGVGKPEDIVGCTKLGCDIFDCVLPTRDARHKRLYVYKAGSIDEIDVNKGDFYEFYYAGKARDLTLNEPVSTACDCLLCTKYTKAYLTHLFRINDTLAFRLATIHNLRFYSILISKLKNKFKEQA